MQSIVAKFEETKATIAHAVRMQELATGKGFAASIVVTEMPQAGDEKPLVVVRGPALNVMLVIGRLADAGYSGLRSAKFQTIH